MIQIELYSQIRQAAEKSGCQVFDGLMPPEHTPYPFVYLGEAMILEGSIKTGRVGQYSQTVHVWSDHFNRRGDLARLMEEIVQRCARIIRTDRYGTMLSSHSMRILADSSTKTPLLHGVIELNYSYS